MALKALRQKLDLLQTLGTFNSFPDMVSYMRPLVCPPGIFLITMNKPMIYGIMNVDVISVC